VRLKIVVLALALSGSLVLRLDAHHAFAAEFDREQPMTVTGTVTKVEWTNPHIWVYLDVKGADGTVTNWGFQGGPPSYLTRVGWSKNDLKAGDTIHVEGFRAKDGSNHAAGRQITLPDGRKVFALQIEGPPQSSESKK
jgi:uncharacterized protein DUF6152